jgi:hypothetical protein
MSARYVVADANLVPAAIGLAATGCSPCTESESDPVIRFWQDLRASRTVASSIGGPRWRKGHRCRRRAACVLEPFRGLQAVRSSRPSLVNRRNAGALWYAGVRLRAAEGFGQCSERVDDARAFGDRLGEVREAMEALAASLPPEELNRVGFRLYERFRPDVATGAEGWGAKGELRIERIQSARA